MWQKHISYFDGEAFMAQKQLGYLPLLFVVLPLVHGCLTLTTVSRIQALLSASLHSRELACHSRNTGFSMKTNTVLPDLVGTLS